MKRQKMCCSWSCRRASTLELMGNLARATNDTAKMMPLYSQAFAESQDGQVLPWLDVLGRPEAAAGVETCKKCTASVLMKLGNIYQVSVSTLLYIPISAVLTLCYLERK